MIDKLTKKELIQVCNLLLTMNNQTIKIEALNTNKKARMISIEDIE